MTSETFRIGTRSSPLAMAQAYETRTRLMKAHNLPEDAFEICPMSTTGDEIQSKALREFGGKGLFTKEIEAALLDGTIDCAVHSMKDMPTVLPDGLELTAFLPREDVGDALVSFDYQAIEDLPQGCKVGTSSLRRAAQIRSMRPDIEIVEYRGNVQTRLRKLREGVADATLLACAGLSRLGNTDAPATRIPPETMLPAIAQGAIGIEQRTNDGRAHELLAPLNDAPTHTCLNAERAFLAKLDGSCHTPIAGLATLKDGRISFQGQILLPDGTQQFSNSREGLPEDAAALGRDAAEELRAIAGEDFFAAMHA